MTRVDTSATAREQKSDVAADAPRARTGRLGDYQREVFDPTGASLVVYRRGVGPAVIVLTEIPGISPEVLGFADMVVALGCTAVLPDLFGVAGKEFATASWLARRAYGLRTAAQVCVSREFSLLATGRSSPIVQKLRLLAKAEHERCGGPGVGVIGMCFTGGFALAMAVDARVLAPVLSQPSLPGAITRAQRKSIDCEADTLDVVAGRCVSEGLKVLGLRFKGDPWVPGDRFRFLREKLGDGFVQVELAQSEGNPRGPAPHRHAVLTTDLIERAGEPTVEAREQVLQLFRDKLLGAV